MTHSEQLDKLAGALAKAQGELEDAGKTKAAHGYKYADLGAVLNMIRPVFSRHGLAISQTIGKRLDDGSVSVTTILLHESGQWVKDTASAPVVVPVGRSGQPTMTDIQATGSITTYLRRYSLAAISGLTQIDDDGQMREEAPGSQSYGREFPAQHGQRQAQERPRDGQPAVPDEIMKGMFSAAKTAFGVKGAREGFYAICERLGFPKSSSELTEEQAVAVTKEAERMISDANV